MLRAVAPFRVSDSKAYLVQADAKSIREMVERISLDKCFDPAIWKEFTFFAQVQPDEDILPVRTVYDGVTQNIGNNYLTSNSLWFAGCEVIAAAIRTGKAPRILRAIRIVPHGKQAGMKSVRLRGSKVTIDPYKDDLFRKVIERTVDAQSGFAESAVGAVRIAGSRKPDASLQVLKPRIGTQRIKIRQNVQAF